MKLSQLSVYFLLYAVVAADVETKDKEERRCQEPETVEHGTVTCTDSIYFKSVCSSKCDVGYKLQGSSRKICWCKKDVCSWEGSDAVCNRVDCKTPNYDRGQVTLVDTWPGGFAGLVVIDLGDSPAIHDGWSVVIVFDRPLGKNVSLSAWNMEMSAMSYDGQTFTLTNSKHNFDLSSSVKAHEGLKALFVVNNADDIMPQSAYVGLYSRRVRDVTCFTAPKMPNIKNLGVKMAVTSESSETTEMPTPPAPTTAALSTTLKTKAQTTTKRLDLTKTTAIPTLITTKPASKSPMVTEATQEETTQEAPTSTQGGIYCIIQKELDYYTTDKGWQDSGKYYFSGNFALSSPEDLYDWSMVAVFDAEITNVETWACRVLDHTEDGKIWTFGPHPWNTALYGGITDIRFIATQARATVNNPHAQVYLCSSIFSSGDALMTRPDDGDVGVEEAPPVEVTTKMPLKTLRPATTATTTTVAASSATRCAERSGTPVERAGQTQLNFASNNDGTKYNYNELLHMSILFYEAQRSGILPANNRIPWRGDSALKDGCDIGVDLTGGWYDAGDNVKFNFPMAFSLTTLAWGGIVFRDAYEDAGELENMIDLIKWPTRYFIKAHISKYELVGQVGHGQTDHNYWGRAEQMQMRRPTYTITKLKPGTELAAEAAAALAASSIFLKPTDPDLADTALKHAIDLFEFADEYRGNYHKSIPDASKYYKSYSGYQDELVWSAAWLYKATRDVKYLHAALRFYSRMNGKSTVANEYSWDQKLAGAQVLLADLTGKIEFRRPFELYLDSLKRKKTTPEGLYFLGNWGTNRYAANAAFMSILGARLNPPLRKSAEYLKWATKQIGLLLGDAGRSYVVGFGVNPPKRAHHGSSSCPPYPERCDWTTYHSPASNYYTLYGALVGGPNSKGVYEDNRAIYEETEVACDYNAGFQSAVAGLKQVIIENRKEQRKEDTPSTETPTTTTVKTTTKKNPKAGCTPKRSMKCIRAARKAKKSG